MDKTAPLAKISAATCLAVFTLVRAGAAAEEPESPRAEEPSKSPTPESEPSLESEEGGESATSTLPGEGGEEHGASGSREPGASKGQAAAAGPAPGASDQEEESDADEALADEPPALTETSKEAPLEEQEDWLMWPFAKKNQTYDPKEPHRWVSAGGFVGLVSRSSHSSAIRYRPGMAWGGYIRPELASWLGFRLYYREERIPVDVQPGAFDYGADTYDDDFEQPDLEVLTLGARLEPTLVVHPRFRIRSILGWSWLWFQTPFPKSDDFELKRTFRSAVQMDFSLGAGLSLDIIENWVDISIDSTFGLPAGRTGSAYEPSQIVRDGGVKYIAPLPELKNSVDVLISLGVIL